MQWLAMLRSPVVMLQNIIIEELSSTVSAVISFVRNLSSSNFQINVTIRKSALLPSSGNGKLPIKWTPVLSLFSVTVHHTNYTFKYQQNAHMQ